MDQDLQPGAAVSEVIHINKANGLKNFLGKPLQFHIQCDKLP